MIVKKPYGIVLLVIFCTQAFGAASSTGIIPHLGTPPEEYQQYEGLIAALRRNDTAHVSTTLEKNPAILGIEADGGITPLHVAVAMERVYGHDPREVIDVFAETASHFECRSMRRENYSLLTVDDPTKNRQLQALAHIEANVNHPIFHLLCTGETTTPLGIKLTLTPLELAARHRSIKTLAALVQYMPISEVILEEPALDDSFELYRAIVEHERTRATFPYETMVLHQGVITPYLPNKLETHIIRTFGARGMELLHEFGIDLSNGIVINSDLCTPFQIFDHYHPDKAGEIAHLRPAKTKSFPAKTKSFVDKLIGCFCRKSTQPITESHQD